MMLDKNGVEIQTGQVVEITGAYFKTDNGFWFVEKAPGDPSWCGSDYCLKKISKFGRISTAKHNTCFWPISTFVNDRLKTAEACRWNREHAQIEVKAIKNMAEVAAHFEGLAEAVKERINWTALYFGETHPEVIQFQQLKAHYLAVAKSVAGEREV